MYLPTYNENTNNIQHNTMDKNKKDIQSVHRILTWFDDQKSYIKKMSEKSSRKSPLHLNFFSIKYIVYEYILFNTECTLFILCLSHIHKINMENLTSIWFTNCYNKSICLLSKLLFLRFQYYHWEKKSWKLQ